MDVDHRRGGDDVGSDDRLRDELDVAAALVHHDGGLKTEELGDDRSVVRVESRLLVDREEHAGGETSLVVRGRGRMHVAGGTVAEVDDEAQVAAERWNVLETERVRRREERDGDLRAVRDHVRPRMIGIVDPFMVCQISGVDAVQIPIGEEEVARPLNGFVVREDRARRGLRGSRHPPRVDDRAGELPDGGRPPARVA
jgi:hypothetical protein